MVCNIDFFLLVFQTTEQELKQFFSAYGAVKDSKIIADRAGVSKG
jgi:RNA recognition motif-containing protein